MANGHGGARIRAGAKKKPLAEKLLEGNLGGKKLEYIKFDDELKGVEMPTPKEYLLARQRDGKDSQAKEIFEETWKWLNERKCDKLIPTQIIEHYAMSVSRWIQCEECITQHGFLSRHPTTGNPILSPFVAASQSFMKQANNIWYQIYQVVRENCSTDYKSHTPHDDVMERLLMTRKGDKVY